MKRTTPANPNRLGFKNNKLIEKYIAAKNLLNNRLWSLVNGKLITNYKGEWLSENEMIDRFPILKQSSFLTNLHNPNKKKNYSL